MKRRCSLLAKEYVFPLMATLRIALRHHWKFSAIMMVEFA
jgi:hypothetical protein